MSNEFIDANENHVFLGYKKHFVNLSFRDRCAIEAMHEFAFKQTNPGLFDYSEYAVRCFDVADAMEVERKRRDVK